jgi:hypothetical protein
MEKENDPQALSEGLNILCKLTAKYHFLHSASSLIPSNRSIEASKSPITPSNQKL